MNELIKSTYDNDTPDRGENMRRIADLIMCLTQEEGRQVLDYIESLRQAG